MEIWKPRNTIRVRSWQSMLNEFGAYGGINTPRVRFANCMRYLCGKSVEVPDSYYNNDTELIVIDGWLLEAEMFVGHGKFEIYTTAY